MDQYIIYIKYTISKFNSLCNVFTSVWSMFVYNNWCR